MDAQAQLVQQFLSTLSLRRATSLPASGWGFMLISIHALLAESDATLHNILKLFPISIHALLAESDPSVLHNFRPLQISIHALLAESDGGGL